MSAARDPFGLVPDPARLLHPDEDRVPARTSALASAADRLGIDVVLSRNQPVVTCEEAAVARWSGGRVGIPLRRELKSRLLQVRPRSQRAFVLVHCRGDQRVELDRLRDLLGLTSKLREASPSHLEGFGISSGTINPLEPWFDGVDLPPGTVRQVFDEGLLAPGAPTTMVTNAGSPTWAVELSVLGLVRALGRAPAGALVLPIATTPFRGVVRLEG